MPGVGYDYLEYPHLRSTEQFPLLSCYVLMAVTMKSSVFWDMKPCSMVEIY
jgi:hypothetical protein